MPPTGRPGVRPLLGVTLTQLALYPQAIRSIAGGVGELAPPQKKNPKKRGVAGPAIEAPQRG